jgi:hypothetical protein
VIRSRFCVAVFCAYAVAGSVELNRLRDQLAAKVHEPDDVADKGNNSKSFHCIPSNGWDINWFGFTFQGGINIEYNRKWASSLTSSWQPASFLPVGSYRLPWSRSKVKLLAAAYEE